MEKFERFIGIDWSGAGGENDRVKLRVVEAGEGLEGPRSVSPGVRSTTRNWKRAELREFLREEVFRSGGRRTIVGIDAAMGYPVGTAEAVFGADGWRSMVKRLGAAVRDRKHGDLKDVIDEFNDGHVDDGGVPFFYRGSDKEERSWYRDDQTSHGFFTAHGVGYYRMIDMLIPGAISVFYTGPGPMVAYHTMTCLRMLDELLVVRDDSDELDFGVWVHEEDWRRRRHLVVEAYPAVFPEPTTSRESNSNDYIDALKIAEWMWKGSRDEKLRSFLDIDQDAPRGMRRIIGEEGWVLGVEPPRECPKWIQRWVGSR